MTLYPSLLELDSTQTGALLEERRAFIELAERDSSTGVEERVTMTPLYERATRLELDD